MSGDLLMQILQLSPCEKRRFIDRISKSCHEKERGKISKRAERGQELIDMVCDIIGIDSIPDNRESMSVLARSLVAYQMYLEGFTTTYIGKIINRDHSTITALKKRVINMFEMPNFYPQEMVVWKEFKTRIENETDTTTI